MSVVILYGGDNSLHKLEEHHQIATKKVKEHGTCRGVDGQEKPHNMEMIACLVTNCVQKHTHDFPLTKKDTSAPQVDAHPPQSWS